MTSIDQHKTKRSLQLLYQICHTAETTLHAASQQMQNQGLKGLFKHFTRQHRHVTSELETLAEQMDIPLASASGFRHSLQRGWMTIRIALIVGRANRQAAAAARSATSARDLLQQYDQVLQLMLPEFARATLWQQREQVQQIQTWLERIVAQDEWIVRLYENTVDAEVAVTQLKGHGIPERQIEVTPLPQLSTDQYDAEERDNSLADAVLVGGLLVGAFGAIMSLALTFWRPLLFFVPPTAELAWLNPVGSILVGTFIGAFFGGLFAFLIGKSLAEEDVTLVEPLSDDNTVVVSVQTTAENHTDAAKVLQMWHQRRVEEIPA